MHRVLIDTDPGIDDALALLMAFGSERLEVDAVTVVAGNCPLGTCAANAAAVVALAGAGAPVWAGADRPLVRPLVTALDVHGLDGLGGALHARPTAPDGPGRAAVAIAERVMERPGELTVVALGPLTNLALALRAEPAIAGAVRRVVVMGGAVRVPGNHTPAAEFNAYVDPDAAAEVLCAGWPVTLVPLDVTHRVRLTAGRVAALRAAGDGSPVTEFVAQALAAQLARGGEGFAMHDPLAVAVAIDPGVVGTEAAAVSVERSDPARLGRTVADFREDGPVRVATAVDAGRALSLFEEAVLRVARR